MNKIKIAFVGHTNTGKTSLIRTLMKSNVGEVDDKANVTLKGEIYNYQGLQADFIDTPGFRHANVYNLFLDSKEQNPNFVLPNKWIKKIELDSEAVNEIKQCNVALYIGSLENVPDDGHEEEIILVKKIQPKVIGILNKGHTLIDDKTKYKERCEQWVNYFKNLGIDDVIIFDSHWDKYSKVKSIYSSISKILNPQENVIFKLGLKTFNKRQDDIKKEASYLLSKCIIDIASIQFLENEKEYNDRNTRKEIRKEISKLIYSFVNQVSTLFEIASEKPSITIKNIRTEIEGIDKENWKTKISNSAKLSSVLGAIGGATGAIIGAIITGLATGGLGAVGGALIGAKLGAATGGGIGVIELIDTNTNNIDVGISSDSLKYYTLDLIAIVWGLYMNGYSRDKTLTKKEILQIKQTIKISYMKNYNNIDWSNANIELVDNFSLNILNELENKW